MSTKKGKKLYHVMMRAGELQWTVTVEADSLEEACQADAGSLLVKTFSENAEWVDGNAEIYGAYEL